ncbi:MAG: GAF domain-containing protein [Polyangiaceae bacterium]|nr:GAF domain-containing protein [Polyangiaceae bacterium]
MWTRNAGVNRLIEVIEAKKLGFRTIANRVVSSILHRSNATAEEEETSRKLMHAHAILDALYANAPIGLGYHDDELRYRRLNAHLAAFNGRPIEEHIGRTLREVVPHIAPQIETLMRDLLTPGAVARELELSGETPAAPGRLKHWLVNFYPVVDPDTKRRGIGVIVRDVTVEKEALRALDTRARQQAEVAALGVRALQAKDLQTVFDDAVTTVTRTLGTDFAKLLEFAEDKQELVLRAGVGWKEGLVGHASVTTGRGSQAGFTLLCRTPVIVDDLRTETRFSGPSLLTEHGVTSGVSTVIEAPALEGQPYGILATHTRQKRSFTPEDAAFLQSVANVVGASILRVRLEERASTERRRGDVQQFLSEAGSILASTLDYEETITKFAHLCVRHLADCCVIHLWDEAPIRRLRAVHRDHAMANLAEALQNMQLDPDKPHLAYAVKQTQRPVLIAELSAEQIASMAQNELHLQLLHELNPVSMMGLPLRAHGRMLGALVLLCCHADRRYGAEDLRTAEELAHRAALAVESARLYGHAQRAIHARDEVLAIVAHDLRNPLTMIDLTAAALARQVSDESRSRVEKAVKQIQGAANRANHLIQDLVDVASIEAGKLGLERTAVQPDAVVADAIELLGGSASEAHLAVEASTQHGIPPVFGDRDRLLQVLANLLGNAVKFTPPGGRIRVRAERRDSEILFWVADTGQGMTPEHLARIFDCFWQARPTGRRGAGLGLSIAKGIVEAHGGRIWAESTPGQGSIFYFTVPIALLDIGASA